MPFTNGHALVIGIANYQHVNRLSEAVLKDARDVRGVLIDPACCGYESNHVTLLLDQQATQVNIRAALAQLAQRSTAEATVFIYLSGHGGRIESGSAAGEYLLPIDVDYSSTARIAATAISGAEFTQALQAIAARKIVVVFDCCHSGGIGQPKDPTAPILKAGFSDGYYEALKAGRGRVILASSRSDEYSYVFPAASNSLFTQHLLAGLRGGAIGAGGVIRIFDLFDYVQSRVAATQVNQHPIFKAELEENFPIALYLGGKSAAAPLPTAPHDEFEYDVFVSYRHQDKPWVRSQLARSLEARGLKTCVDYRDFRLGAPLIKEMERAVERSRYTLAVLTPAYLESNFTELESVLAQHVGLEQSQHRLLCILREPCRPRLSLRAQLWLDMTEDEEFEANIERLAFELRRSAAR
jgi:hypothetical protein